jgi:3-oxoacyl-[acyl-carrier-protein] synthase-3
LHSDGDGEEMIWVPGGGGRSSNDASPYFQMSGREVFQAAVASMTAACRDVIQATGWTKHDVRWVVPHQANRRILHQVLVGLGLPLDRAVVHLDRVGNTSAASIPLALTAYQEQFAPGDQMLLTAFGGGLTWGAGSMTWPNLATLGAIVPPCSTHPSPRSTPHDRQYHLP